MNRHPPESAWRLEKWELVILNPKQSIQTIAAPLSAIVAFLVKVCMLGTAKDFHYILT